MPRFSTNQQSNTASDHSHAHLIWLQSTTHGEVSWLPLLWIGNHYSSRCYYSNYEDSMVTYLGALSRMNAILIPRISAHPPILAQCKVHRPWALFREGTVIH